MQQKYFRVLFLQFSLLVTPIIFFETAAQTQKQLKQMVISASIAAFNWRSGGKKMIKHTCSHSASGWIIMQLDCWRGTEKKCRQRRWKCTEYREKYMGKQRRENEDKAMHKACMAVVNISITEWRKYRFQIFFFFLEKVQYGHISVLSHPVSSVF